jgi:predicted transcriptional regulator
LEINQKALEFYKRKGFVEKEKGISEDGAYIYVELQHPQTKFVD